MREERRGRRRAPPQDRQPLPLPEEAGYGTLLEMLRYSFPLARVSARLIHAGKGMRIWIVRPPEVGFVIFLPTQPYHDERLDLGDVLGWITEANWRAPLLNRGSEMQPAFNRALDEAATVAAAVA